MVNLIVVRHAVTGAEIEGIVLGRVDLGLSDEGIRNTQILSHQLKSKYPKIDYIFSSPLKRALETAHILNLVYRIKVENFHISPELIERDFGKLNGLSFKEFSNKYPDLVRGNTANYQPDLPSGESILEVENRVNKFLDDLSKLSASSKNDLNILVITHSGIIRILNRKLLGLSLDDSRQHEIKNLEITEFKHLF